MGVIEGDNFGWELEGYCENWDDRRKVLKVRVVIIYKGRLYRDMEDINIEFLFFY